MFNRLTGWWGGNGSPPEQTDEERCEEVRQRRLQQLGAVTVEPISAVSSEEKKNENPTPPDDEVSPPRGSASDGASGSSEAPSQHVTSHVTTSHVVDHVTAEDEEDREKTPVVGKKDPPIGEVIGGSAVVREVSPDSDNPWATEWVEDTSDPVVAVATVEEESLAISRVFVVTVSTEPQAGSRQPRFQTMLLGAAASHSSLSLDILDEVLFERLSMTARELSDCAFECGRGRTIGSEPLIVPYLLGCAARAGRERGSSHIQRVLEACRKAAVRMIGIVLLSNDAWSPQDPAKQLTEGLLSLEGLYTSPDHDPMGCVQEIISSEETDEEDLVTMVRPILDHVMALSSTCSLNNAPHTLAILNTLTTLTSNRAVAKMIPDLEGWMPRNPDDGAAYESTLLGCFLSCSTIRTSELGTAANYISPHFSRSTNTNPTVTQHSQARYQDLMDNIQSLLSKLFFHLIKSAASEPTLRWIVACLEANRNKAKLVASLVRSTGASDGFMLNLSSVLLKLCIPFLGPLNPKMCSIDARFCAPGSSSILPQTYEDRVQPPRPDTPISSSSSTPAEFNFITKCFFLTHRALQLAYIAPFDKYRRLMKSLMETQNLVQDLGSGPMPADLRERFEVMFVEQLEVKTHLLAPDTITQVLLFYASSANWLSQLALSEEPEATQVVEMRDGVKVRDTPSPVLSMIPSYFISTSCQFLVNLRYFAETSLENFRNDYLDHLLTFLVLFCSKEFLPNPHTRAEIVEALTVFVPNERSQVATINRESALCSNALAREMLGAKLIGVFVDVEQGAEFEHKFQYRYHIFELLQYLWPKVEFGLPRLAEEVRGREEDTTVLFTKFVQLLMNDANFLLDESFRQLEEIRKIEQLQEGPEWGSLEEPARAAKLRSLAELKRMCTYYCMMAHETVRCLQYMTETGGEVVHAAFTTPLLVDTLTTMLNYYLKELVSETQIKYKIKNLHDVKFYPDKLLIGISEIFIALRAQPAFIAAIPRDGRSYHPGLFGNAVAKLRKLAYNEDKIALLQEVSKLAAEAVTSEEVEGVLTERAPENYLDPILGTLMAEPVLLPTSKVIVERSVIAKHLLSDPIDPFNRQPLTMADVIPQEELREEIAQWKTEELTLIQGEKS